VVLRAGHAEHPYQKLVPVWIGDYVLAGWNGTVMAVPCGDERDYAFAHFFKAQSGMQEIKTFLLMLTFLKKPTVLETT
jgi:leucyl-tRNA synthetase